MRKEVIINNYSYEVTIVGNGQPVWVFLHGFMGSQAEYQQVQPNGTRVYLNLLGFGPQAQVVMPAQKFRWRQQVQDLNELLQQLNFDWVNMVGYSMGARLALAFITKYPQRLNHLVLEGGTAGLATQSLRQERIIADTKKANRVLEMGMPAFINQWEQMPLFKSQQNLSAEKQAFMHEQRVNQHAENVANSLRFFGTGAMPNLWAELPNIQVPVTLITGLKDQKFTKINRRMKSTLPNATWYQIKQAGHNVHFEQTDQVTAILNNLSTK